MKFKTIYPEVTVADEQQGICEYVASDESMDSDNEVIRVSGWKFDRMEGNAPFINSHQYRGIENQLGKVLGGRVETSSDGKSRLVETVKWAIDVPENRMAQIGYAMTKAGYLKAVSVGFLPTKLVTRMDPEMWPGDWSGAMIANANMREGKKVWQAQCEEMGNRADLAGCKTIYMEQQQTELSACIIGANPNALAKSMKDFAHAYKAGLLKDADLDLISQEYARRETANSTVEPAVVEKARQRARTAFIMGLETKIKRL